ncbi:entry exclusion lipoprotein TrbK [Succinivibrio dextrinosolvens DSM 3072]|uniref:Entry exclusion lipoprotein TrbK n=1 Tax=Succinivibrio dextrinosolvens DSM 3072 TaxID=1123324 RepID=A0A1T4V4S4_9GAMM|nr:hypothetical protein [Succinivibrio dextrinosolvens]SKA59935.1 entry exclusion lipoprotein TrbK [Succinivibrio dextrinosolvens DSM 3072]
MKLSSASLLLTAVVLNSLLLTGCFNRTAKVEPNNWNCRHDTTSALAHRIEKLEQEGKIDNASEFIEKCQADKLGIFSEDYEKLSSSADFKAAEDKLYAKWEKEAKESTY